jgi:hypothetical protein
MGSPCGAGTRSMYGKMMSADFDQSAAAYALGISLGRALGDRGEAFQRPCLGKRILSRSISPPGGKPHRLGYSTRFSTPSTPARGTNFRAR